MLVFFFIFLFFFFCISFFFFFFFFFQAEDGIRDTSVTGVQTCALPISSSSTPPTYQHASRARCATSTPATTSAPRRSAARTASRISASRQHPTRSRSEERRVGKECGSRWWRDQ